MLPLAPVQGDGRHAHELPVLREHLPVYQDSIGKTRRKKCNLPSSCETWVSFDPPVFPDYLRTFYRTGLETVFLGQERCETG